jgi:hypothetical protein
MTTPDACPAFMFTIKAIFVVYFSTILVVGVRWDRIITTIHGRPW